MGNSRVGHILLLMLVMSFLLVIQSSPGYSALTVRPNGQTTGGFTVCFSLYAPPGHSFQLERAVSYLEAKGFTLQYLSPKMLSAMFSGSASAVGSLFHTQIVLERNGSNVYYTPVSPAVSPSELSGLLVGGLSNRTLFQPQFIVLGKIEDGRITQSQLPHSLTLDGLAVSATYLSPQALREIYNVTPLIRDGGRGQTVAIIDAYGDPNIYQDLNQFDSLYHLPPVNLTIVPIGQYQPSLGIASGWNVETALDVEAVHSIAPYAKIVLVVASSPANPLFEAVDYVVSTDIANITSMSWGAPENLFGESGYVFSIAGQEILNYPYLDYYFQIGAQEGITFLASSGDEGSNGGTPVNTGGVLFPSSSPFVTSVGGTTVFPSGGNPNLPETNVSYGNETAWSISAQYLGATVSSTGGYSTFFPSPWYQRYVTHSSFRTTPDVSADANPYTGFPVVVDGQQEVIGGTSLSSPLWAGMVADMNSYLNVSLGLLSPYLYSIYQSGSYTQDFHRIYFGSNGEFRANGSYNLVTGLGTPNVGELVQTLRGMVGSEPSVQASVSVPGEMYPQAMPGQKVSISAEISYPNGTTLSSGKVSMEVVTPNGEVLNTSSMEYNGSAWEATYLVPENGSPGTWYSYILLNGKPIWQADFQVGLSGVILSPVPYPLGPPLEPNQAFVIEMIAQYPNGTQVTQGNFTAYFIKDGRTVFSVPLVPVNSSGIILFVNQYSLLDNMPQGNYIMVINGSGLSIYTYETFGNPLSGGVVPKISTAIISAPSGSTLTAIAQTISGTFSSNVTVYLINQNGTVILTQEMEPATNAVQFGFQSLFGLYEANITLPSLPPGFYTLLFHDTYNSSSGLEEGNFTTQIYVSPPTVPLNLTLSAHVFEGQRVYVYARAPVNPSLLTLALYPLSYSYISPLLASLTEVSMYYNSTLGEWVGNFTVPSIINNETVYQGLTSSYLSGPWGVIVSGESYSALPLLGYSTVYVLPYTYLGSLTINSSISTPFLFNGQLRDVAVSSLTIQNQKGIILDGDYIGNLTVVNSSVQIIGSTVGSVVVRDSALNISKSTLGGTKSIVVTAVGSDVQVYSSVFQNSTYAFRQVSSNITYSSTSFQTKQLSAIPQPIISPGVVNVTAPVSSLNFSVDQPVRILSVTLDGRPAQFSVAEMGNTTEVSVQFNSTAETDGVHQLTVTLSNGISYTEQVEVSNLYHQVSLSQSLDEGLKKADEMTYVTLAVALVALLLSVVIILRRR